MKKKFLLILLPAFAVIFLLCKCQVVKDGTYINTYGTTNKYLVVNKSRYTQVIINGNDSIVSSGDITISLFQARFWDFYTSYTEKKSAVYLDAKVEGNTIKLFPPYDDETLWFRLAK